MAVNVTLHVWVNPEHEIGLYHVACYASANVKRSSLDYSSFDAAIVTDSSCGGNTWQHSRKDVWGPTGQGLFNCPLDNLSILLLESDHEHTRRAF